MKFIITKLKSTKNKRKNIKPNLFMKTLFSLKALEKIASKSDKQTGFKIPDEQLKDADKILPYNFQTLENPSFKVLSRMNWKSGEYIFSTLDYYSPISNPTDWKSLDKAKFAIVEREALKKTHDPSELNHPLNRSHEIKKRLIRDDLMLAENNENRLYVRKINPSPTKINRRLEYEFDRAEPSSIMNSDYKENIRICNINDDRSSADFDIKKKKPLTNEGNAQKSILKPSSARNYYLKDSLKPSPAYEHSKSPMPKGKKNSKLVPKKLEFSGQQSSKRNNSKNAKKVNSIPSFKNMTPRKSEIISEWNSMVRETENSRLESSKSKKGSHFGKQLKVTNSTLPGPSFSTK